MSGPARRHGVAQPPPGARLPAGFAVRLDTRTRTLAEGRVLLGGAPLRLLKLSAKAVAVLGADGRLCSADPTTATLARRLLDAGVAHPDLTPEGQGPAQQRPGVGDVTVVVPVRDRPDGLARLLDAVRRTAGNVGVLVVDDGSVDDGSVAAVCARHDAAVLRHPRPRGPAAARNSGLAAATTTYVALLDSDCLPLPGWLEELLPHLTDPLVAAVAPRIVGPRPGPAGSGPGAASPPRSWIARYEALASSLDLGPHPSPVAPHGRVPYVPSAALLVRRAAMGTGFDERMQVAEDVDLVWRLSAAGWRVRYEPAAEVGHEHRTRLVPWMRRRAFYGTGAAPLAARHGDLVAPVVLSPWSATAWLALAVPGPVGTAAAALSLAVAGARLRRRLSGLPSAGPLAARLVGLGTLYAGRQLASALVRHYWPLTAALALAVRPARRLAFLAAVADGFLGWWPYRRRVALIPFAAVRRLDDLCYGAGLWWGAVTARSAGALRPRLRSA